MKPTRILLVGEAAIATRMCEHLRTYGEVEMTTAQHFHSVPAGTSWVLILDGGTQAGKILSAAGRADARALSIPASWSHAEGKLQRAGFFGSVSKHHDDSPPVMDEGLALRPFAQVADAIAKKERERAEAERKAREATERGLNPPPLPEPEPTLAPEPAPEPEKAPAYSPAASETRGVTGEEAEVVLPPYMPAREEKPRTPQSIEKERRLEEIFTWNPELSISDAGKMLAGVSSDGRALGWNVMSDVRRRVRARAGLETEVRRYSRIDRIAPGSPPELPLSLTPREERVAPGTPVPPPTPTALPYTLPLPRVVEDASRLLSEELERAAEVGSFTLTYKKGERVRVRWRPDVEGDLEL